MIVGMKKVTIVVQDKDRAETLTQLACLGLVHVEHIQAPVGEVIEDVERDIHMISRSLETLPPAVEDRRFEELSNWKEIVSKVLELRDERLKLMERSEKRRKKIDQWDDWGDFDVHLIKQLGAKGIYLYLAELQAKDLKDIPDDVVVQVLSKKKGKALCAIISDKEIEFPFATLSLPAKRLSELMAEQNDEARKIKAVNEKLSDLARFKNELKEIRQAFEKDLEFERTCSGMGQAGKLAYLEGYCPVPELSAFEKASQRFKWATLIEEPTDKDRPPTLITNPKWISLINPVIDFIKTIPGYREVDISLWFLIFFSVFFGMLIGDAGYGALVLLGAGTVHYKYGLKIKDKTPILLMYVLGFITVLWGVFTATFFGQAWLPASVKPLLPWLTDSANMQRLCFFLGALHLSIAHLWRGIRKAPSLQALADGGWICMLWGSFYLVRNLIIGEVFPPLGKWLYIIGMALIVLFTKPQKNMLKAIGLGTGDLLLNAIASFTDIVSYIRLFAVGLATVAVADAFNQIAMEVGWSSVGASLGTTLILLLGHSLNMILGALAILVHGVRLNVLEFSGHLNMEWSGFEYNPFKGKKSGVNREK
ncbi:MAG: hypothetical protein KAX15_06615, partial [Candidatus Omnitrophica bacterium]|nr:hypothetical protein [Candidatus Omnitrophota bacterium]